MPSEFYKEDETNENYGLQSVIISMANFFLAGGDIKEVENDALAALKEAVKIELEIRRGAIH